MSNFKRQRTAETLRGFLAAEISRLGDSRLELVTITGCDMSPDLKNAWVYWSVMTLGSAEAEPKPTPRARIAEIEEALEGAANLLKRRIADDLELRYTPRLVFRHDHSLETSSRIEFLVKKAASN